MIVNITYSVIASQQKLKLHSPTSFEDKTTSLSMSPCFISYFFTSREPSMNHTLFILLLLNILICLIKTQLINKDTSLKVTPNWLGKFYTTAKCDIQKCCCIYELITLTKVKPNYLQLESRLYGYNCPTDPDIDPIITMPTGFQAEFFLPTGPVDITLNDDSSVMTLSYQSAPECTGTAIRSNARSIISINQIKMILIIFIFTV